MTHPHCSTVGQGLEVRLTGSRRPGRLSARTRGATHSRASFQGRPTSAGEPRGGAGAPSRAGRARGRRLDRWRTSQQPVGQRNGGAGRRRAPALARAGRQCPGPTRAQAHQGCCPWRARGTGVTARGRGAGAGRGGGGQLPLLRGGHAKVGTRHVGTAAGPGRGARRPRRPCRVHQRTWRRRSGSRGRAPIEAWAWLLPWLSVRLFEEGARRVEKQNPGTAAFFLCEKWWVGGGAFFQTHCVRV